MQFKIWRGEGGNNLDRRCIMEDAQIGGIFLRQDRLF